MRENCMTYVQLNDSVVVNYILTCFSAMESSHKSKSKLGVISFAQSILQSAIPQALLLLKMTSWSAESRLA